MWAKLLSCGQLSRCVEAKTGMCSLEYLLVPVWVNLGGVLMLDRLSYSFNIFLAQLFLSTSFPKYNFSEHFISFFFEVLLELSER